MSETSAVNTIARERVDVLSSRNAEQSWLREERLSAWEAYLQTPMPNGREEEWRRTQIDQLNFSELRTADLGPKRADRPQYPKWIEKAVGAVGERSPIVSVRGQDFWSSPACGELLEKGVIFCELNTALEKYPQLVRHYLFAESADGAALGVKPKTSDGPLVTEGGGASVTRGKFALINKALFNGGVFLYIPKNAIIDEPFFSVLSLPSDEGLAVFPRIVLVCEANSQASIVNIIASDDPRFGAVSSAPGPADNKRDARLSLCNAAIEVHIGDGAKLSYVEVQRYSRNVFAVTENRNVISRDGTFASWAVGLGGLQLKSDIYTVLDEPGAESDIRGVVVGDGDDHFSFNTIQDHNAPDTKSNINFRVALKERASSVYLGTIRVDKEGQRTDSYQSNKNLLLGTEARADSIPKLEILADDVKCSHGATVGPVDKDQVFYLMSRGLSAEQAEELIVTGFFASIVESCTIPGASAWINELVAEKVLHSKRNKSTSTRKSGAVSSARKDK